MATKSPLSPGPRHDGRGPSHVGGLFAVHTGALPGRALRGPGAATRP